MKTNALGKLMEDWGFSMGIKDTPGKANGSLSWKNKPWMFEPADAQGKAKFDFEKGYLEKISDVKVRLFSLLNLQSLSRRLSLDFEDVYKKGFFYDKITGDVQLKDSKLVTDNLLVDGNAAKINLSGQIDLDNETIEQRAIVVPKISSSAPLIAAWAVEPTTGLLVYLLNKMIFEPTLDVVTRVEYRIHGDLDDIKYEQVGKTQSKVALPKEALKQEQLKAEKLESKKLESEKESTDNLIKSD
jgi:uncharacterized protein YhdP